MQNNQKIPEGWSVERLEECFSFSAGGDVDRDCFSETKDDLHPYPIYANALTNEGLYGYSSKYKVKEECITITGRGDIGKVFYRKGYFTPIVRLITAIPNVGMNAKFMSYACSQIHFFDESTGVPQLTVPQVQWYRLLLPPLPEQEKIAGILGTWDEAIEKLSSLIEQKKLLKKGLMQRLLTGKTRLNDFTQPWKEVKLGDMCKITTGKLDANAMVEHGIYKFFTCARETFLIDKYAFDTEALLISGNGANVGYIHYYNGKFNAYQRTYVLDKFINNIFLIKYMLEQFLSTRIEKEKKAGNTPYIVLDTLSKMKLNIPVDIAEQKAIADILSTADEEIDLLNKKLEALKEQKKGLMQQLLTGQTRVKVN